MKPYGRRFIFSCEISCEIFVFCVQYWYCFSNIKIFSKTLESRINKRKVAI
nr:MAG TPA: hypothetical protein [Caudoviricetes sp.]